jgi:hypothetical protein
VTDLTQGTSGARELRGTTAGLGGCREGYLSILLVWRRRRIRHPRSEAIWRLLMWFSTPSIVESAVAREHSLEALSPWGVSTAPSGRSRFIAFIVADGSFG